MNIEEINWNFTAPKTHILVLKWPIIQNEKDLFCAKVKGTDEKVFKVLYGQC